jgi:hypothetical protein
MRVIYRREFSVLDCYIVLGKIHVIPDHIKSGMPKDVLQAEGKKRPIAFAAAPIARILNYEQKESSSHRAGRVGNGQAG